MVARTSLTGVSISDGYSQMLHVSDTLGLASTLTDVYDANGTQGPLQLSTTQMRATQQFSIIEQSTPTVQDGYGFFYPKSDNIAYYLDGEGHEHPFGGHISTFKDYSFTSRGVGAGTYYEGGYYFAPTADSNLDQAGPTQALGSANSSYAAHAFVVVAGVGSDDKTTGAVELEVSGTSITDAGVRNASATEVIIADIEAGTVITNAYFETSLKWIGQVTYTLQNDGAGDAVNFSLDFNYGFCKYEDFGNRDFNISDFEAVGVAAATDTAFNITLLHHSSAGWTYSAAAFDPGGTVIADMNTDHDTETSTINGEPIAYKRFNLDIDVDGSGSGGIVVKIITGQNNTVQSLDIHVGIINL